jgi:hypothetical protein
MNEQCAERRKERTNNAMGKAKGQEGKANRP